MNLQKALAEVSACGLTLRLLRGKVRVVTSKTSQKLPAVVHAWLKYNKAEVKEWLQAEEKHVRFKGEAVPIQYWQGEELGDVVALDTETLLIPDKSPDEAPALVVGAAYDGHGLFMFGPDRAKQFMEIHKAKTFVFHNARFDVRVIEKATGEHGYLLQAVDEGRVYCTNIFEKLLNLATTGVPAFPSTSLDNCAERYFGINMPKDWLDEDGDVIRHSYSKHQGKIPADLPPCYRTYAGLDPVVTWHLLEAQKSRLPDIKAAAQSAYGFTTDEELAAAWSKYGPLSHHVQLKGDLAFGYMTDYGLGRDVGLCLEFKRDLEQQKAEALEILTKANLQPGKGSAGRLQEYIAAVAAKFPDEVFEKTPTGAYKTCKKAKQKLFKLTKDKAITALQDYARATKWISTYLKGLLDESLKKIKVEWKILAKSGRTTTGKKSKGTALPAQCLPKDMLDTTSSTTIRQCLRPALPGYVFIGADYATLEVVTFASELLRLGMGRELADVVIAGKDVHRALAAAVYNVPESEVTAEQRKSVKPFTFGIPGCMAGESLQKHAAGFGVKLSLKDVEKIQKGYARLNPAIDEHLAEEGLGSRVAKVIGARTDQQSWGFLGTIAGESWGRTPDPAREWRVAKRVALTADVSETEREKVLAIIKRKVGCRYLFKFFSGLAGRYSQLSPTGRLRAKADFRPTRNGLFQAPASDGGLLTCWALLRQGFKPVAFIHDEVICATPDNGEQWNQCEAMAKVMVDTMEELVQLPIKVEPFVRQSFSPKDDLAKPEQEPLPPADAFCKAKVEDFTPQFLTGDDDLVLEFAEAKPRRRKVDQCTDRFTAKLKSGDFEDGDLPW